MLYSVTTNPLESALKLTVAGHPCTRFKREFLNYRNCETEADDQGKYSRLFLRRNIRKCMMSSCQPWLKMILAEILANTYYVLEALALLWKQCN